MPHEIMTQYGHIAQGLPPVANAFASTVRSDVFNMKNYNGCTFLLIKGVGTSGTTVVTVNACDDATPSNRTAIVFRYRLNTTSDTWGAVTTATTSGFTTTAGSNHIYEIIVDAAEIAKAGYGYVELNCVEATASAVLGGILWIGHETFQPQNIPATAIV